MTLSDSHNISYRSLLCDWPTTWQRLQPSLPVPVMTYCFYNSVEFMAPSLTTTANEKGLKAELSRRDTRSYDSNPPSMDYRITSLLRVRTLVAPWWYQHYFFSKLAFPRELSLCESQIHHWEFVYLADGVLVRVCKSSCSFCLHQARHLQETNAFPNGLKLKSPCALVGGFACRSVIFHWQCEVYNCKAFLMSFFSHFMTELCCGFAWFGVFI